MSHPEPRGGGIALAQRPSLPPPPGPPGGAYPGRRPAGSLWHRPQTWVLATLALIVVGPLLAFFLGWMIFKVPTAEEGVGVQTATFTFAKGEPLAIVRPKDGNDTNINRSVVPLEKVPVPVRQAVLAAEDRTFYSNPGFDIVGIVRAIYNQVTGGVGGGSTITQQYIKVSTGQDEASLWRKYKEVVLSVKISKEQTKDQILENYLNTIYLGRGAYGVQAASRAYFDKDVGQLSIAEGAMLAGMIQSPSALDPTKNVAGTTVRWNYTLDQMVQAGFLSPTDRAAQAFPADVLPEAPVTAGVPDDDRYHIYERARAELEANGVSQDAIDTEGVTITTTVDAARQKAAVDAVNRVLKSQPDNLRAGLASIDPRTGAIVAYYGGSNGLGTDYAGQAHRQPGSTFKPFVVAAALRSGQGIGLGTEYTGTSPMVIAGQKVANSDGDSCDRCSIMTAMTKSTNTVFYQLAVQVGPQKVVDAAHQAGIPVTDLTGTPTGGISLGDQEVFPVDMASAYGTFAADGQRRAPYIVQKAVTADGRVLLDRGTTPQQAQTAFPQQVARNVTESMLDVANSSGFALAGGRAVAAKTGTVQADNNRDNKDAWTVGFTPSLSTAVWVGTDRSDPIRTKSGAVVFGRTLPGPIFQRYMNTALKNQPKQQFSDYVPMGPPAYASSDSSAPSVSPPTPTTSPGDGSDPNQGSDNGGDSSGGDNASNGNTATGATLGAVERFFGPNGLRQRGHNRTPPDGNTR